MSLQMIGCPGPRQMPATGCSAGEQRQMSSQARWDDFYKSKIRLKKIPAFNAAPLAVDTTGCIAKLQANRPDLFALNGLMFLRRF